MHALFAAMRGAPDIEALWRILSAYFSERGITRLTAVHLPPAGVPDDEPALVHIQGYPKEWIAGYLKRRKHDPIPVHVRNHPTPFRWAEIGKLRKLTPEQKEFLAYCKSIDVINGVAIPVFGPNGRNGYIGIGLSEDQDDISDAQLGEYQIVAQIAHQRLCEMMAPSDCEQIKLSPRQKEILEWVARGKSNASIAEILGISADTVDTHLRRTYDKLDVTDRVRAAIRGIGCGLIDP